MQRLGSRHSSYVMKDCVQGKHTDRGDLYLLSLNLSSLGTVSLDEHTDTLTPCASSRELGSLPSPGQTCNEIYVHHI